MFQLGLCVCAWFTVMLDGLLLLCVCIRLCVLCLFSVSASV